MDDNFNQILGSLLNQDPKMRTQASELIKISSGMLGNKINSKYNEIFPAGSQ